MTWLQNLIISFTLFSGVWAGGLQDSVEKKMDVLVLYKDVWSAEQQKSQLKTQAYVQLLKQRTLATQESVLTSLGMQSELRASLWLINASVVRISESQRETLAEHPLVLSVSPMNRKPELIQPIVSDNPQPQVVDGYTYGLSKIGVPQIRAKYLNLDGRGIRVGIIDTGIAPDHPDLAGKVKAFHDFTTAKNPTVRDDHGHGSHVAGTIAGGQQSGTAIGVAPGAELIIAKGFTAGGTSTEAGLLESLQWMVDPNEQSGGLTPKVISNSWGLPGSLNTKDPASDPFCIAIKNLNDMGIVSVFASGNSGPTLETVRIPGACPDALTVGATDANDRIASFSSRGPVRWKNLTLLKPDVVAPGVDIFSVAAKGGYTNMSGTSMATPHVAGALAILAQAHPEATANELKELIKKSSVDLGAEGDDSTYGSGRIDLIHSVFKGGII